MQKDIVSLLLLIIHEVSSDLPCLPRSGAPGEGAVCVCSALYCDTVERPPKLPGGSYFQYTTSHLSPGFSRRTGHFTPTNAPEEEDDGSYLFKINNTIQYQEILGFGGAFTDTAGYLISSLPEDAQNKFMESYFGITGVEYNLCRMPIGGSDFSPRQYTLDDVPDDLDLAHFSLTQEDHIFKIAIVKKAKLVSKRGISVIACAWTAPYWMKTQNHLYPKDLAGYLKFNHFQTWAEYHLRFIQSYKDNGIDVWAISGGNQPTFSLHSGISINNTISLAHQQRVWLKNYLVPALERENLTNIKFFTFEENRNRLLYWMDRFALDPEAFKKVDGVAIHWYTDYWSENSHFLDFIHSKYPEKTILYTESSSNVAFNPSSEAVTLGSWNRAALYINDIIETLNHWVSGFIDWNLALDPGGGPTYSSFPVDAPVIVNVTSGEFFKQPMFYALGHFSKFIPPGSRRVEARLVRGPAPGPRPERGYPVRAPAVVSCLATANSDGSYTVVLFNNKNKTVHVILEIAGSGFITTDLEKHSINSFVYWL